MFGFYVRVKSRVGEIGFPTPTNMVTSFLIFPGASAALDFLAGIVLDFGHGGSKLYDGENNLMTKASSPIHKP